ncbi:outer membrane protein, cobalt-zinc-cadmium efflux system [Pseudarcicella hirudinis]|uniref:Outer membrane protein, cobalt-zinc-cadmium efflux system n=1 Tax=Pseudarcicella hirudinis TaxID=1079859 RepID=A0A1I5MIW3_9BACT|nr:TolC family protein [Pseudarcicella hirudinis]SFP09469.1 outer membrane protein, cobalt-zinc-cadmium efflux system [Pseudarcicella hirudinis]
MLKALHPLLLASLIPFSLSAQNAVSLKNALKFAQENNPILKTQKFNFGIAEADLSTAGLRPNPSLNNQTLLLADSKYFAPNTDWANNKNRQVWWQLTKRIQLPSQRAYKIEVAKNNLVLTQKNYAEFERNFSLDVANKWLDVWIIKNRLGLLTKAQSNLDTLVNTNKIRFKNQVITETELIRTQLLLDQYNLQLKSVQQEYKNEIERLKFLLGVTDNIEIDENSIIESLPVSGRFEDLLNQALNNRTDILAANSAIELNKSNIKLQKSLAIPQPELGAIWNPQNTVPYIGFFGTISLPFFDRNQGNIQRSQIEKSQNEQNLEVVQLQVKTELSAAFQTYLLKKENLSQYDNILQQSEKVLSNVRFAYIKGGTTIIDYLDAQRSWFDTRQLYYETLLDFHRSYVQLLYVSGNINQL